MEKPDEFSQEIYQAYVKAMKRIFGELYKPSKNELRRQISSPTKMTGCKVCGSRRTTLYKATVNGIPGMYCRNHKKGL